MRDFYVYGFKSRDDYQSKSARSYDDERRRLESWLGDHMSFVRTPEGKNVFISIDSRTIRHNPLYNAWKAKSFTDGDITLHFIIFDILHDPSVKRTISELLAEIDGKYLSGFECPMMYDESTVRKKLKEYCEAGIIVAEKEGRKAYYRRADSTDISNLDEVLHYFSEVAPCGVVGSFILDKEESDTDAFTFKHHYITGAIDSGVLASLFTAMREKRAVTISNMSRRRDMPRRNRIVPLRVFISVQNGRQHLLAYLPEYNSFTSYRVDYLSNVKLEDRMVRIVSDILKVEYNEARKLLDYVDFHGVCGLDFRFDPDNDRIAYIETNARFTGGLATPVAAGFDIPWVLYKLSTEGKYGEPIAVKEGTRTKWILGDVITLVGRILSLKWNPKELKRIFNFSHFDAYDDFFKDDKRAIIGEFYYYFKKLVKNGKLNP